MAHRASAIGTAVCEETRIGISEKDATRPHPWRGARRQALHFLRRERRRQVNAAWFDDKPAWRIRPMADGGVADDTQGKSG